MEKATENQLEEAVRWLIGFREGYLPLYTKARALVPEAVWETYESTGVKGSYEQGQLDLAKKLIRAEWDRRPNTLKRRSDNAKPKIAKTRR